MKSMWFALLVMPLFATDSLYGETWAERIGYPKGERVLILYGNYMGGAHEFNERGQELLEKGYVQSAGVMPPCPWFESFATWCRNHPQHDVGICLTLNSPGNGYRWGPVSRNHAVASLVDPKGYLWRNELQFALRAQRKDVQREIDAQIQKARASGIRPSHLNVFLGSLLTRPELLATYLETAERNWTPAVMVAMTPENIATFRAEGFPLSEEMIHLVRRYSLPKLDQLHFIAEAESYELKRDKFYELVKNLPPGLIQITAGPASESSALKQITSKWQSRVWEGELLADPEVWEFLEKEGVTFTNWIEVMRRFEAGASEVERSEKSSELESEKT